MSNSFWSQLQDCSWLGFSVHGIPQARILEWVALSSSRGILLTQGWNPVLLHWQAGSLPLSYLGSPSIMITIIMIISLSTLASDLNNLPSWSARKFCSRVLPLCIWKHRGRGYTVFFPNLIHFCSTKFSPSWLTFSCLISFLDFFFLLLLVLFSVLFLPPSQGSQAKSFLPFPHCFTR